MFKLRISSDYSKLVPKPLIFNNNFLNNFLIIILINLYKVFLDP
jgi:hypothetical protein